MVRIVTASAAAPGASFAIGPLQTVGSVGQVSGFCVNGTQITMTKTDSPNLGATSAFTCANGQFTVGLPGGGDGGTHPYSISTFDGTNFYDDYENLQTFPPPPPPPTLYPPPGIYYEPIFVFVETTGGNPVYYEENPSDPNPFNWSQAASTQTLNVTSTTTVEAASVEGGNELSTTTSGTYVVHPTTIQTLAGPSGFSSPQGVAVNSAGDVYVADAATRAVYMISHTNQAVTVIAGIPGSAGNPTPGLATNANLNGPAALALDAAGTHLYISDNGAEAILEVDLGNGNLTIFAGIVNSPGHAGDNGPATSAQLNSPSQIAIDGSGNLFIADTSNHAIRKVAGGTLTTVAGVLNSGGGAANSGENGPANSALLNTPSGVATDSSGNLYISDTSSQAVRKVRTDGTIVTLAMSITAYDLTCGGVNQIYMSTSNGVALLDLGSNYQATFAGMTAPGYGGDGGPATSAHLAGAYGITYLPGGGGTLIIADSQNMRVRTVTPAP